MYPTRKLTVFWFAALILVLFVLPNLLSLAAGAIWFKSVGYAGVFWTTWGAQWGFGLMAAALALIVLGGNLLLVLRRWRRFSGGGVVIPIGGQAIPEQLLPLFRGAFPLVCAAVSLLFAFFYGLAGASSWLTWLQAFHAVGTGGSVHSAAAATDPIFHLPVSFYLFTLPAELSVQRILLSLGIFTLLLTAGGYVLLQLAGDQDRRVAYRHGGLILAATLLIWAWGDWLGRPALLVSQSGYQFGPDYTAMHATLPFLYLKGALALAGAGYVLWIALSGRAAVRPSLLAAPIVILAAVGIVGGIYGAVLQNLVVAPNQATAELPYIADSIASTNRAYGTNRVQVRNYPAKGSITAADLAADAGTIRNLRIMDYRPLLKAYTQLQGLRLYYKFPTTTVDRYTLGGKETEVILAPRELDQSLLPAQAQTWVNLHEKYTHGYGVVMSPVNAANSQGEPQFIEQNIPPTGALKITRPEIYFGLDTTNWVITGAKGGEFDYAKGGQNVTNYYHGTDGIPLRGWNKLVYSLAMGTSKFYLDSSLTSSSRLLLHRQIQNRVQRLAPFLQYDSDPYLVVSGGRLYWILDAYTTSTNYPYANPENFGNGYVNYIRNSVKVVVDAYNGTTTFYRMPGSDPVVANLSRIYPGLFKPFSAMPAGLRLHLRYPEDLFNLQAKVLEIYHMTDPSVFYNQEDAWNLTTESYAGGQPRSESYYTMVRLPGSPRTELVLMNSFTPANRNNMVAWLAARMDPPHYGQLVLEEFPKDRQVYGPMQIESLIQQNPAISQDFTLWNQSGSQVIQGNLLVIPVHGSLLYVEPIYLQATGNAGIPELKRVIVASTDQVVMGKTLGDALAQLVGAAPPAGSGSGATPNATGTSTPSGSVAGLVAQANTEYQALQSAANSGDWTSFGQHLSKLGSIIQQMQGK